ncbi:MAG TPA: hypothetical protein VMU02_03135 [bacterium]|nr:hypothetical protein [bacterium]
MRRHPAAVLAVLLALLAYGLARELGHRVAIWVLRLPCTTTLRYGFLPAVDISRSAGSVSPSSAGWVTLAGPLAALAAGYAVLVVIVRRKAGSRLFGRTIAAIACYLCLVLDPIYYAAIPFFNLGGEPETVASQLGLPLARLQVGAVILLILNIILTRKWVMPFLRQGGTT